MERKQNDNQNQNQNQNEQRFNHNSNASSSSNYRGLPQSSTQQFQRQWINRNDPDRNSSNNHNIIIRADQVNNFVPNRILNSVAIGGNLTSRRDLLNPVQNQMLYVPIQENIAAQFDPVNPLRNRTQNVQIREYLIMQSEYVSKWAMTIEGCKCLRSLLAAEDGGELRETILAIVAADLPNLMVHNIGSLFVRALFLSCNELQMNRVLQSVFDGNEWAFFLICYNYYGSESVKTLIQNLRIEAQLSIVTNDLAAHISYFTNFKYCKSVLEFFIDTHKHNFSKMRLLINVMAENCLAIAMNESGSRFLQLSICPMFINRSLISSLLDAIVVNAFSLAKDKYGNYLVKHVIDANIGDVTKRIVGELMGRFCDLAKSKIGSYVVQKCLRKCEKSEVVKIVEEFTNSSQLCRIAQDHYGHYVLRCALKHVCNRRSAEHYRNLVNGINLHVSTLKDHPYGKEVIIKINELNSKFPYLFSQ